MACLVLHSGHVTTRDTLFRLSQDRASDEFVFYKDVNDVNDYALGGVSKKRARVRRSLWAKPFQEELSGTI